jgi:drug/metabolite transporter (DMT)-like permease
MGELLALLTALLYSGAVIFYKKSVVDAPPFALNLFKNAAAWILLALTSILLGQTALSSIAPSDLAIMLASGALGIGVSDTLFLTTLKKLGASRTALVDCLYSPFVILFSFLTFRETVTSNVIVGGMLIIGSVLVSSRRGFGTPMPRRDFWAGCVIGAAAMATVAYAVIMVKPLLHQYPLTLMSAVRMTGGLLVLLLALPFRGDRKSVICIFKPHRTWKWILAGTFLGSYLAIISWLAGFKYSPSGVAALLNQTSTVFIILFAWMFLREPMTRTKFLAAGMAFAGAAILLY